MISEKNVKNYLKIKKAYENDTSIAIIEDVASTVLNNTEKRQYNSKEDEEQSKIIKNLMKTYKERTLDLNNDEEIQELQKAIANIMKLELQKIDIDIRFDPEDSMKENKNDILLEYKERSEEDEEDLLYKAIQKRTPKYTKLKNKEGDLGDFTPKDEYGKDKVTIYLGEFKSGLTSKSRKERIDTCKTLFHVIFHELRHYKQFLLQRQGISSKKSMLFAKDNALYEGMDEFYYENYGELMLENDANLHACERLEELLGSNEDMRKAKIFFEEKIYNGRYKMSYMNGSHKEERSKAYLFVNDIIKQDEERRLLKKSPILSKEYDIDTLERIRLTQLISEMNSEQQFLSNLKDVKEEDKEALKEDAKEMYYDVIYQSILESQQGEIQEALIDHSSKKLKNLLEEIEEYKSGEINKGREKAREVFNLKSDYENSSIVYFKLKKCPAKGLWKMQKKLNKEEEEMQRKIGTVKFTIDELESFSREFLKEDNKKLLKYLKELKKSDDKEKEQKDKEQGQNKVEK